MVNDKADWAKALQIGGRALRFEIGQIAGQAGGALLARCDRTVLLATATADPEPAEQADFLPLTVEYREKFAAAGRIPGGFFRREGRAATHEILGSRLVDRSVRPHFPDGYNRETQVLISVLSFDPDTDPELLAITAGSAALHISDIPWDGPVAGVRIARSRGELCLFPDQAMRADAELDLIVTVSRRGIVMVEGGAREVPEEDILAALETAAQGAAPLLDVQDEMRAAIGRAKPAVISPACDEERLERVRACVIPRISEIYGAQDKRIRRERMTGLIAQAAAALEEDPSAEKPAEKSSAERITAERITAEKIAHDVLREEIRRRALEGQRLDGRAPDDIRAISGLVGWLPAAHGSSLFTRGETQAMVTCTLGSGQDELLVEDLHGLHRERFLLHYNFPPYAVGEVRPLRSPGRREIGHGQLARRAVTPILPGPDEFPYTIRIDAEIASSNGSSSMATVCGASLALMDAGVPVARPVAGIAMGLIAEGERRVILSDILGDEDHLGDMDFKVAGTTAGVTAMQLDNKLGSLPHEVLAEALAQAARGRQHILAEMAKICAEPRPEPPAHAPRSIVVQIRPARIRDLIGPGGRHIQDIQRDTGAKIDVDEDGHVRITGPAGAKIREAERRVHYFTGEPVIGGIYRGEVTGVTDFGCFVQIFHGIEGLVHVSDLDRVRVEHPGDIASVGAEMMVKVMGVTKEGRLRLSRREALDASPAEVEV